MINWQTIALITLIGAAFSVGSTYGTPNRRAALLWTLAAGVAMLGFTLDTYLKGHL